MPKRLLVASWGFASLPQHWLNGSLRTVRGMAVFRQRSRQREPHALAQATLLRTVSITFRSLDMPLCDWLSPGTHLLWHLINAGVLYLSARALMVNERRHAAAATAP